MSTSSVTPHHVTTFSPSYPVQVLTFLLRLFDRVPLSFRHRIVHTLIRLVYSIRPQYRTRSYRNLEVVFPEASKTFRDELYHKSLRELSIMIVDMLRLPLLSDKWFQEHVTCPNVSVLERLRNEGTRGVVFAGAHLGSFEFVPQLLSLYFAPISTVVRIHGGSRFEEWWNSVRSLRGNSVVSRVGALRSLVKLLSSGQNVGILFDQNVVRHNGYFVNWFGVPAATTKGLGSVAVMTGAPVLIVGLIRRGDRYELCLEEVQTEDLYHDSSLSRDEKAITLTERATQLTEKMILEYPEGWFWMHRKWRTRPDEQEEVFYRE